MSNHAAPVTDVLGSQLGRHRMWVITLELQREAGSVPEAALVALDRFASRQVLELLGVNRETGIAHVRASKRTLEEAFGGPGGNLRMVVVEQDGTSYRSIAGSIKLPSDLAPWVVSVDGFDTRPARVVPDRGLGD